MLHNAGAVSVEHYENFPVASWLCPPRLRPAITAIYWFARTADDLADEGTADVVDRLAQLASYREATMLALADRDDPAERWPNVFIPLRRIQRQAQLPQQLLMDLLDAFEQDAPNPLYRDRLELLDYCRRSANPIGRLLLHLYGVNDAGSLRQSDAVCSALQLINFWQDIGLDAARGRCYVPQGDAQRHDLSLADLRPHADTAATRALLKDLCSWSASLMQAGASLALRLPGRAGWELRLVIQGGLKVLEKIAGLDYATLTHRPTLHAWDAPGLLMRAITMKQGLRRYQANAAGPNL